MGIEKEMAGKSTFLVLINQRSGGQDGPQLLDRFRQLAQEGLEGQEHLEVRLTIAIHLPSRQAGKLTNYLRISQIPTDLFVSGCFDD